MFCGCDLTNIQKRNKARLGFSHVRITVALIQMLIRKADTMVFAL